jgi:type I restriction enzyme, R subunit
MAIVVYMFLTGFDATTLNTLWVDKSLRAHGLIQAYSRTNRILNSVKTYGTIVSFRDLEEETNDALALFGNKDARGVVILKPYADYYGEYEKQVAELVQRFPLDDAPDVGEANQKKFVGLFGAILRLRNILTSFDEFAGHEIISPRDFQDYQSVYLNFYAEWRQAAEAEKESINDEVVFEIELIKQVEVNVDYILNLVQKYRAATGDSGQEMAAIMEIQRAVDSSPSLRNKKDLIIEFVNSVSITGDTAEDWKIFVSSKRDAELDSLIAEEGLKADETKAFAANAFRDGAVPTAGTAITRILPPASRFSPGGDHGAKKQRVLDKLAEFFDRYFGLV